MVSFDNFDTDYSGMNRFNDIMQNGGNVDLKRLQDFIKDSVNELADTGIGAVKHIDFGNGLSVVVAWEEAVGIPENEDNGAFVDGGYQICVSVRETDSAPRVEEWNSLAGSVALTESDEADEYAEVAEELYVQVVDNDPETVDTEGEMRDETIYDEIDDLKGAVDEWIENINKDGTINVVDANLDKVTASNGATGDGIVFTIKDEITDSDASSLDELFTELMSQKIIDFVSHYDFDYVVVGKHEFAFVAW